MTEHNKDFADEFWSRFDELAEKFAEYTADYGPQVVDLGLNVVRIDGLSALLPAIVILALIMVLARKAYPKLLDFYREQFAIEWRNRSEGLILLSGIAQLPFFVAFIICLVNLLNIWNWIAVFAPELEVARRIIGGVAQ